MRRNLAKEKLAAGRAVSVIAPTYTSAGLVELVAQMGFDIVFIDCEHGPAGWDEVENMVRAAELWDSTALVRVQSNDPAIITRALDRGAGGVLVPYVNTRAEAEAAVRAAKYAPLGRRGFAGGRSTFGEKVAEFTERANAESMVVAMIEEVEALKNLDEILTVDHIDAFFIGHGDLAQSMGYPGRTDHPEVQAAIDETVRRIRAAGRAPGVLTTPATVQRYLDLGALFIYTALASLLQPGARAFLEKFSR